MEEDVELERETKKFRLSTGLLMRGEGGFDFYGFVEGKNQESRQLQHFWVEDGETEGKEGCVYYYVRVGGEATWFPTFTEEDAQVVYGTERPLPEVSREIVEIKFGGDVMLAEMVDF